LYALFFRTVVELENDPFMGSGSTGVACINTHRNFISIELDKTYFETAKTRLISQKKLYLS